MHMTAEALEGIESEIQKFVVQVGSGEPCDQAMGKKAGKQRSALWVSSSWGKMVSLGFQGKRDC